jgi:1,2-diacylglycerol 3-alpha-glucosyltransferase
MPEIVRSARCRVAVIWIDWYPYHVARFRGLEEAPSLQGSVVGIELVGGVGVHKGLKFREELPAGLRVETLMPQTSWLEANKLQLARMLWRRLSELDPEVVLVPGYYTLPAIAAAMWARVHGRTSVLMTESTASDHARVWWKELPKKIALRTLFHWAVTGGQAHVAYLRQLGFPADRIVGCYDVVDNAMFRDGALALRATAGTPAPYFLYVGRLAEEKNVAGLLTAWVAYREQGGTWPLALCGDGPERTTLQAQAAGSSYGADVDFPGLKSSRELLPFYAHAGCFVLPSTREPWGLVVNEAMAAELPVLVSERCGCAPDLVREGVNGFAFDPANVAELTRLLLQMEQRPAAERNEMGQRSGEIIGRFTPRGFGNAIAGITAGRMLGASVAAAEVAS